METFIKETDNKGRTYIIEGTVNPDINNVFSVKRFICEVQEQATEKETQELADFILIKLKS